MTKKKAKRKLSLQQEMFCKLYASDKEFFGNGVQSYIEAYDIKEDGYNNAKVNACKLLTKPNIIERINELLEIGGLSEVNLDKQLNFCVTQYSDLNVKIRAIAEANKLKGRITDKVDNSFNLTGLTIKVEK